MISKRVRAAAMAAAAVLMSRSAGRAALSFYVEPNNPWPSGWYAAAVANMQTTVNAYNAYGDFGNGSIYVYYNAGIPTAQSGYGGSGGSIGDGGTYPNVRVLLHESSHWLGTGTYSNYWQGGAAGALEQQFDGVGALLNGDTQHYWPYGENYDNESSAINDARHVAMVYALREDFGIGSTAAPSAATTATLAASDPAGTSGFNYPAWSDAHFAQPSTAYSTGNYALRTPNGYAPWTFAGGSLTVNNTTPGGGLVFNGYGTSGVVTIKNLIVDGGSVTHGQYPQDLFQLAGRVTLTANGGTFNATAGNISVLAPITGAGPLTTAGPYAVTLSNANTYAGATNIGAGSTVKLGSVASSAIASYSFDNVSGSTVVNDGVGGSAMNGTLANGAAIVAGGKYGNAVSLANGASVDINSPIEDLGSNGYWSVSAWVKTATAGGTILSKSNGSGWTNGNTVLYLSSGNGAGSGGIPGGVRWAGGFYQGSTSSTSVTDSAWHQVTYVDNGGSYAIYVDGAPQALAAGHGGFGNGDVGSIVRLGLTTDGGDGTANFNGQLDNVQFYASALSATQATALYQNAPSYGSLPATTNVTIATGGKLDLNGAGQHIGSLAGAAGSAVTLGAGQLTVNSSANTTFAGAISGAGGSLVKQGTGTLTLGGAESYTGATILIGGTLRLTAPGAAVASYSFDNVSGGTVVNGGSGGAAMNGVLANGASIVPGGRSGNAVSLAGGASVNINNPITDLGSGGTWTVAAWEKTITPGSTLLSKSDGTTWTTGNTIFYLGDGSAGGSGGIPSAVRYAGGFLQGSTSATAVTDGTWHQVTYVDTAGAYAIYVDGVAQPLSAGNAAFANADVGSVVRLGATTDTIAGDGTVNFNGLLDGVQVYAQALTAAQVATMYQSNGSYAGPTTGPLPATTTVTISTGATLDVNGTSQTVAALTGAASSAVTLGAGQLTTGGSNAASTVASVISGTGSLVKVGTGTLTLAGVNTFTGGLNVSNGTVAVTAAGSLSAAGSVGVGPAGRLTFAANPAATPLVQPVGALTVSAGGRVTVSSGAGRTLLSATGLSVAGTVELGANDLDVRNGMRSAVTALAASGFAGGTWTGTGLTSSAAAADPAHLTAVGVVQNVAGDGVTALYASFDGQPVSAADVLARYTYYGDANLDGTVTAGDYVRVDAGFVLGLTGWGNGDFNYDGTVDGSDYTLMDNAFNEQAGLAPAVPALAVSQAVVAAVPEPAVGLLGLAVLALPRRRRRVPR